MSYYHNGELPALKQKKKRNQSGETLNDMWEIEHGLCACTERYSPSFSEGIVDRTGAQTMLYLACTTISSVDLAQYGVSLAKDWVSVKCGTMDITAKQAPKTTHNKIK